MHNKSVSYNTLINHYTARAEYYEGFINIFQFHATILNSDVLKAQLKKKSESYDYDSAQIKKEEEEIDKSLKAETNLFLSFFSPDPKIDDLSKAQTVWRIFLDVNNKRYQGSVKKYLAPMSDQVLLFPYHTRFSTAYVVHFNIPAIYIQDYPMQLTITGTAGSKTVSFPAMKE